MKKLFPILIILISIACSPAKMLEKGQYKQAFIGAQDKLRKGKDVEENTIVLNKALEKKLADYREKVLALKSDDAIKNTDKIVKKIDKMIAIIEEVDPYVYEEFRVQKNDLINEQKMLHLDAYTHYKAVGEQKLAEGIAEYNKYKAQNAFRNFVKAKKYDATDGTAITELLELAKEKGTFYYKVISDSWSVGTDWHASNDIDDLSSWRFVVVNGNTDSLDCTLTISFDLLDADTRTTRETLDFEKRVVVDYDVEIDTSGNRIETPIYETITGEVRITKKTRTLSQDADVYVKKESKACRCRGNSFNASKEESVKEYSLSGNRDAIPDKYKNQSVFDQDLPSKDESKRSLIRSIIRQFEDTYL